MMSETIQPTHNSHVWREPEMEFKEFEPRFNPIPAGGRGQFDPLL